MVLSRLWALVGENDDVVRPKENIEILKRAGAKVTVGKHKHRTPPEIFAQFFKEVIVEF